MVFNEDTNTWMLRLSDGHEITTRFVVTAVGTLSTPTLPKIEGIADFRGISFHASNWPHEPLDLTGKRVAVIGSGATAIQLIPEVAKAARTTHRLPTSPKLGSTFKQRTYLRD